MKTLPPIALALFSGFLFFLGWPVLGISSVLFVAWLPLLHLRQKFCADPGKYKNLHLFLYSYLAFFTWNLSTTWWIWNASPGGATLAILANSLLMAITFTIAHIVSRKTGDTYFPVIQISTWIAFEYFHHNWDLTWPWLTLGNGLAGSHTLVQWYEYTGILGGSLWILALNHVLYSSILKPFTTNKSFSAKNLFNTRAEKIKVGALLLLIAVPASVSELMYEENNRDTEHGYQTNDNNLEVVIVQPNIDPYGEKFSGNYKEQLFRMMEQAATAVDSATDYLVFPETAITELLWENDNEYLQSFSIQALRKFREKYPRLNIIIGASTARHMGAGTEKPTPTSKKYGNTNEYYEDYNTAILIGNDGAVKHYHKSKFVPGVEKMPYPAVFGFLEDLAIDMGGTSGSLTGQEERTVFTTPGSAKVAPAICYESIFGEFTNGYIHKGAQAIAVITNDGWWGNSPGYKQHLVYGRLRAIETGRWIIRSANTGISCFINNRGDIIKPTNWWEPAVIKHTIPSTIHSTFYVDHGDYIGKASVLIFGMFILLVLFRKFQITPFGLKPGK